MEDATLRLKLYEDTVSVHIGELGEKIICEDTLGHQKEIPLPATNSKWEILEYDDEYVYLGD